jgi:hypothetical protein
MARIAMKADGVRAKALWEGVEEEEVVAHLACGPRAVALSAAAAGCGGGKRSGGGLRLRPQLETKGRQRRCIGRQGHECVRERLEGLGFSAANEK